MPADPVTVAADQAFAFAQLATALQGMFQGFHRTHPGQPRRQVECRLYLVQQAAGHGGDAAPQIEQAQLALLQRVEGQPLEIVQQHAMQIGAKHGFHRQLPARLDS
ncbi:hypothetical protein D9M71_734040 [compost metagenome]